MTTMVGIGSDQTCPCNLMVTGGAGFIGSNFVRWVGQHHPNTRIVVFDALTYAAIPGSLPDTGPNGPFLVKGDICDPGAVERAISEYGIDTVVHFAAESHNDNAIQSPDPFIKTNIQGTYILLQAVRRHDLRFHHISTDEVYGDLDFGDSRRFDESSPYRPSNPYSASKAASDHLVRAWWRTYGTRVTISNCSNNYGPRQHVEKFIPRQITNILAGIRPRLYGEGRESRDWIHVQDNCEAIWTVLTRGILGSTYLISADNEYSNREVLAMILEEMGQEPDAFDRVPNRPGVDRRYALDSSRIQSELGWRPRHHDFRHGLRDTIDWYASHQDWWRLAKEETERRYKIQGH
ncbi:dTDP-glucose 4,6-dehydratase [Bifidobacterium asteroides]|uniref:dTDP-glucose 4,6-dehydratase n=1 Tax=Bifidobacterium asteroides TaxID=1684 RepID=UPI002740A1BA|nr:dTDP-glucose 4,6-dehydratase [Bifidobacterium asteroides]WLT10877.1 dTDP-glucose 4,6-dehydratase [Bifidobacterium asteroides]